MEEWNERLVGYINDIDSGNFITEKVGQLIDDCFGNNKLNDARNTNLAKIKHLLPKIKKNCAEYYNCNEDEIAIGDVWFSDEEYKNMTVCPYKIILGDAWFDNSQIQSLGDLSIIAGNANFNKSLVKSLDNLTTIGGSAYFGNSQVESLANLKSIGRGVSFESSKIKSLDNLIVIGDWASFVNSEVESLGNLKSIGGFVDFGNSKISSFGNVEYIGGEVMGNDMLKEMYYRDFDSNGYKKVDIKSKNR